MNDNRLLQSKESQFARPALAAGEGNPFSGDPPEKLPLQENIQAEEPIYVTTYHHRGGLLLGLALAGLIMNMLGLSSILLLNPSLIIFSLMAFVPCIATVVMAAHDQRCMTAGVMDSSGQNSVSWAYWLAIAGIVCSSLVVLLLLTVLVMLWVW